jgi:hypothetical protein
MGYGVTSERSRYDAEHRCVHLAMGWYYAKQVDTTSFGLTITNQGDDPDLWSDHCPPIDTLITVEAGEGADIWTSPPLHLPESTEHNVLWHNVNKSHLEIIGYLNGQPISETVQDGYIWVPYMQNWSYSSVDDWGRGYAVVLMWHYPPNEYASGWWQVALEGFNGDYPDHTLTSDPKYGTVNDYAGEYTFSDGTTVEVS